MDRVDFPALDRRLSQNGAQEKLNKLWIDRAPGLGGGIELRSRHTTIMRLSPFPGRIIWLVAIVASALAHSATAAEQRFQSDEWITECDNGTGSPDCSITVPFWRGQRERDGSFALVVMLQTGNVGIVGQPFPLRAVLRVDKNPPVECRQARYCVFPSAQALAVLKELKDASLILVDVFTAKGVFNFSLTPKGYQAGIAQVRAWGYRLSID